MRPVMKIQDKEEINRLIRVRFRSDPYRSYQMIP
jgi:hypothetical protein